MTGTRCTPNRWPRTCTPATPRWSAQEQQACALVFLGHSRSVEVERLVELGWLQRVGPRPARIRRRSSPPPASPSDAPAAHGAHPLDRVAAKREAALELGPVLVQVARPGYAPELRLRHCAQRRPLRALRGSARRMTSARSRPTCRWCGAIAAQWRCPHCDGTRLRQVGQGTARTAEDLGRAFPGVRVILADGEHPVQTVGAEPALVIATRGAEPIAAGGYRAVLLLDGETDGRQGEPQGRRGLPALVVERHRPGRRRRARACWWGSAAPWPRRWPPGGCPTTPERNSPTVAGCGSAGRAGRHRHRHRRTPSSRPWRRRPRSGTRMRWGPSTPILPTAATGARDPALRLRRRAGRRRGAARRGHPLRHPAA